MYGAVTGPFSLALCIPQADWNVEFNVFLPLLSLAVTYEGRKCMYVDEQYLCDHFFVYDNVSIW